MNLWCAFPYTQSHSSGFQYESHLRYTVHHLRKKEIFIHHYCSFSLSLSLWRKHTSCTETMSRGDFVDKSHLIYNHSSWEFFLLHFFVWWWMAEIIPPFITLVSVSICTTISHNSCDYFDPTEPMFWYICLVSSADGSLGKSFSFLLAEVGCTGGSAAFVLADSDLLAVSMVAV